jgi:hypothetical protein
MNKRVTVLCLVLAGIATGACKHKPAYSDIDANANRPASNQNQNAEAQPNAAQPSAGESQASPPPATPPEAPKPPAFKRPRFLDEVSGEIKDLPGYPGAYRATGRIGPSGEANMASFVLQSSDSMDKIVAFYERVIKANRWTVLNKVIDQEASEWRLSKGQDESAKVEVKKDQQTGRMTILVVRGERL